jgi:hypothetical protein
MTMTELDTLFEQKYEQGDIQAAKHIHEIIKGKLAKQPPRHAVLAELDMAIIECQELMIAEMGRCEN